MTNTWGNQSVNEFSATSRALGIITSVAALRGNIDPQVRVIRMNYLVAPSRFPPVL